MFDGALSKFFGLFRPRSAENVRETLEELIEDRSGSETPIDDHERILLGNVLRLRDVTAADVMVPRADIVAVDVRTDISSLIEVFTQSGHSRLPVFRRSLDDVIGMVHHKDILLHSHQGQTTTLSHLIRRVLFVSPSMRALDLLLEMRLKRIHMALVVDEFGGIDGLATIEDVVEQIVGEINDEHDTDPDPDLKVGPDGLIEADGRAWITQFEDLVGPVLSDEEREEVDTMGGLVFYLAGRVPARGEVIVHPTGYEFEIIEADPRRVKRMRVKPPAKDPSDKVSET
jgi:CBS domain containing-hemolysin-like protein